ncbi:MAG: N-acetyltransferase, partial [Christensenellaceae bacterium]|nr:N-acetyltransferase [Christensenellaceae bacterium]
MVTIIEANTKRLRKQFVQFQNDLYKDCPQYVPTMLSDEMANLDPKKNPAFEYCEMKLWLAMRDGNIVGRVGGIISHKANEIWDRKRVRITRLDVIDDMEVSRALIDTVQAWGKEKGMTEISGPLGTCDMDKEGMLVDGFDKQSMFITYYNHP